MKVIFLDIDGVLNSELFYRRRHNSLLYRSRRVYYWTLSWFRLLFTGSRYKSYSLATYKPNPKHWEYSYCLKRLEEETDGFAWKLLADFCNSYNIKICISSTWRHNFKNTDDWELALLHFGFVPFTYIGITPRLKGIRGNEIASFIESHSIEQYAILDDDSDMLPEQMPNFFLIDRYMGITSTTIYKLKKHFNIE